MNWFVKLNQRNPKCQKSQKSLRKESNVKAVKEESLDDEIYNKFLSLNKHPKYNLPILKSRINLYLP